MAWGLTEEREVHFSPCATLAPTRPWHAGHFGRRDGHGWHYRGGFGGVGYPDGRSFLGLEAGGQRATNWPRGTLPCPMTHPDVDLVRLALRLALSC